MRVQESIVGFRSDRLDISNDAIGFGLLLTANIVSMVKLGREHGQSR